VAGEISVVGEIFSDLEVVAVMETFAVMGIVAEVEAEVGGSVHLVGVATWVVISRETVDSGHAHPSVLCPL
jgi:hypothetical protein